MAQADQVAMRTKLAFGIGATGEASCNWIFNALTFFFYNQILGLSGILTALAVTIGIFSDAISDPLTVTAGGQNNKPRKIAASEEVFGKYRFAGGFGCLGVWVFGCLGFRGLGCLGFRGLGC